MLRCSKISGGILIKKSLVKLNTSNLPRGDTQFKTNALEQLVLFNRFYIATSSINSQNNSTDCSSSNPQPLQRLKSARPQYSSWLSSRAASNWLTSSSSSSSKMINSEKQSSKVPPIADQLLLMPAYKLSKLIKDGSITSQKLCELFVERIKQVNHCTNAMSQDRFKAALEEAKQVDQLLASFRSGKPESEFSPEELELLHSPLMGVPVSVKESIMVKGMRNSCGLWNRRNIIADEDAVAVANAKRFGMIPICTTNVPECTLYWADCQNKVYGRSLNPYDPSRITGASSGGEGALLGGGGSVIGIGSDIGGSLRLPAHYCGIFSHKPSPFLVSPEGNFPIVLKCRLRMFTMGPMCRYASDLRPLLKCLISDRDNPKQDTYSPCQPENISAIRKEIIQKLDNPITDLSQLKIYYFDFNSASELKGKQSLHVLEDIMDAQKEIIDHFSSKFNCQTEHVNLDKFFKKTLITWQCLLTCGAKEDIFDPNELKGVFKINSLFSEMIKMPFGLSKHTKESLITLVFGSAVPKDPKKALELCEKFEKLAAELKAEIESLLGDNGVLITPTLPTVAYKHNVAWLKMSNLRFTALYNILQLPVTHATVRLDKKHKLPFGFSIAAKQNNDPSTIAIAEEIEVACGGWVSPNGVADNITASTKAIAAHTSTVHEDQTRQQAQVA